MPLRLMLVLALCVLGAIPVVAAMAASPDPGSGSQPNQSTASADPGKGPGHGMGWGMGGFGGFGFGGGGKGDAGGFDGGVGRGGITITAIDGDKVSLATQDGWSRTVTVTADTAITKGGKTIKVTDLAVNDEIVLREKRNTDGTYTITAINVRTPKAGGKVSAVTSTTVTVTAPDGTKTDITVNGSTTYLVGKDAGTKSDVIVGSRIVADGTKAGSTFTATQIVIEPSVAGGEVTAKTNSTITVKGRDGKPVTIHVGSGTTFRIFGKDPATLADIAVGDTVIASGTLRSDGSLDATQVGGGKFSWGNHAKPQAPASSATPG